MQFFIESLKANTETMKALRDEIKEERSERKEDRKLLNEIHTRVIKIESNQVDRRVDKLEGRVDLLEDESHRQRGAKGVLMWWGANLNHVGMILLAIVFIAALVLRATGKLG